MFSKINDLKQQVDEQISQQQSRLKPTTVSSALHPNSARSFTENINQFTISEASTIRDEEKHELPIHDQPFGNLAKGQIR